MEETYRSQFRLPYSLYELLKKAAVDNHRSVNAELVARLQDSFSQQPSSARPRTEHETTIQTLTEMYRQALERIADLKRHTNLSAMDQIELQHEEETAKFLRHAAARAMAAANARNE